MRREKIDVACSAPCRVAAAAAAAAAMAERFLRRLSAGTHVLRDRRNLVFASKTFLGWVCGRVAHLESEMALPFVNVPSGSSVRFMAAPVRVDRSSHHVHEIYQTCLHAASRLDSLLVTSGVGFLSFIFCRLVVRRLIQPPRPPRSTHA